MTFTDPDRALELVREALNIAERLGDPETLGHVLLSYRLAGKTPGNADAGHPTANRLITLGRRTGYTPFVLHGLVQRAWTFREEGDLASADRAMSAARSFLGDEPAPVYAALFILYRSSQLLLAGDLARAEEAANEVLSLASSGFDATLWYGPALMTIRGHQARLGELIPLIEAATGHPAFGRSYQAVLAAAYAFAGQARRRTLDPHHLLEQRLPGRPPQPMVAHRHDRARRDRRHPRPPSRRRSDRRAAPTVRRANRRPLGDRRDDHRPRPRTDGTHHRRPPARKTEAPSRPSPPAANGTPRSSSAASCSDSPPLASTSGKPRTPHTTSYTRRWQSQTEPARRSSTTRLSASASSTHPRRDLRSPQLTCAWWTIATTRAGRSV